MEDIKTIWAFVIALAAVVNGMGIVRLLGGLSEYLKNRSTLNIQHYWVYNALFVFQVMAHLLLWWSILGLREVGSINFLNYLYLIIGPTLLYLASSLMVPDADDSNIDLRSEYFSFRKSFYGIYIIFWLWAIFSWPVFGHGFSPTAPLLLVWLLFSVIMRLTDRPGIHAALVTGNCVIYAVFIFLYAMQFGAVARSIVSSSAQTW